jgi:hypothetical protein
MSIKTPSDAYLLEGAERRPSDMHTRSGYPIWTLVSIWYAREQSDDAVITEYALDPREWATAKAYYFAHQQAIDARRVLNDEQGSQLPGAVSLEDLLKEQGNPKSKA